MAGATAPRKKSYAWAWFLGLLVVASLSAAALMIQYNLSLQLKPERLDAEREKWKAHGPKSYRLTYTQEVNGQGERFQVKVRDGKVEEVLRDGRPLELEQLPYYSMDRLFAHVEKFLALDQQPGQPKTYTRAHFDERTGAIQQYIRQVRGAHPLSIVLHAKVEDLPP